MTDPRELALDVVVPVYNEEVTLERSVRALAESPAQQFDETRLITIADNASSDSTPVIADRLALEVPGVQARHLSQKGRGSRPR
jgi:glycosyltransferase involved in cell wall biosynthesis